MDYGTGCRGLALPLCLFSFARVAEALVIAWHRQHPRAPMPSHLPHHGWKSRSHSSLLALLSRRAKGFARQAKRLA